MGRIILIIVILMQCIGYPLAQSFRCGIDNYITKEDNAEPLRTSNKNLPQRIMVFPLFAEEMLLEMIGSDRIVFVGHRYFKNGEAHSPTMEMTKAIPGEVWSDTGIETIVDLNPDLIITLENDPIELAPTSVPVLRINVPQSFQDIKHTLALLGETVGAEDKAKQMIEQIDGTLLLINNAVSKIPIEERLRTVYCWDGPWRDGGIVYYMILSERFSFVAESAGLIPLIAHEPPEGLEVITQEQLIEWAPDLLVIVPISYDTNGAILDVDLEHSRKVISEFINDPKLASVPAIKNRKIYPFRLSQSQFAVQSVIDLLHLAYPNLLD